VAGERTEGGGALRIPGVPGYNGAGAGQRGSRTIFFFSFLLYYSLVDGWMMMGNMGDGIGAPQPTLLRDG